MESSSKKLAYLALGLGAILLIILFAYLAFGRKSIISPVPEEGIKVIFVTPQPSPISSASPTVSPSASPKPTPRPTVSPSPSLSPSPTATP